MKKLLLLLLLIPNLASAREGKTFETRGSAEVLEIGTFTIGTIEKNIAIPRFIDVTSSTKWNGLYHDNESGWTRCRVPQKSGFGWTGPLERSLIFKCKPITYFD